MERRVPLASNKIYNNITTTTSTMATRPSACVAPSPSFSPKRKYFDTNFYEISSKKRRLSSTDSVESVPSTPLYKNFGNGLSLCNNTKTLRFANIDEVVEYLALDESTRYKDDTIQDIALSEDVLNEFIHDLNDTKELPELNLNLWDLRDMLQLDLDLL